MNLTQHTSSAIELLGKLIETPSHSGEETGTADVIAQWLDGNRIPYTRVSNNIYAFNRHFDRAKPSIILNSHHDTVLPNAAYTREPYGMYIENGKLYGLGSNDAGGALVSLLTVFAYFYERAEMQYNLIIAATAEEENSGPNGLNSLIQHLPEITFAIVGEPTGMHLAIAEKGLLVIDAVADGTAGHAAHDNTVNAIYNAIRDIDWIRNYTFSKTSDLLGRVKMTVTQINAGQQHNVVPATCTFVIDVRVNEHYTNQEVFDIIEKHTTSRLTARSMRHNSSQISSQHPVVLAGVALGRKTFGSPTLSDQSVLTCPSLKLGPGESHRSHQADEYILTGEIAEGIRIYIALLNKILCK